MPTIHVTIHYEPDAGPFWLNPDNVAIALNTYCENTTFNVEWAKPHSYPYPMEWSYPTEPSEPPKEFA